MQSSFVISFICIERFGNIKYCNANAKKTQIDRVAEAKKAGADRMLMFCPKCQIHFRCAVQDKVPVDPSTVDVKLEDFTVALARLLNLMSEES